jgi:hypothetical protein
LLRCVALTFGLFQAVSCFVLLLLGTRICVMKWREKRDSALTDAGPQSSNSQTGAAPPQAGSWPQFQFALLSTLAGATGLGECICHAISLRSKYSAFCLYFVSNCQIAIIQSKFEDFLYNALNASNLDSGSFWMSAVNTAVLNFVQLILIKRLFGTLAVADANWFLKVDQLSVFNRVIARLPAALCALVIVASVTSIAAQTADVSYNTHVLKTFNTSAILNDNVADAVQVGRLLAG